MVIPADLSANILRLYKAEHWRVGTIARQLHVHRDTVRRVLAQAGEPAAASPLRPSRVDPYRAFILQTLAKFPTLTAARLFAMVHERGYRGSPEHFRHVIAGMRPRPAAEAFLRLRTLPGEQALSRLAHFGHLRIGRARRPLMAFVMVLSYSAAHLPALQPERAHRRLPARPRRGLRRLRRRRPRHPVRQPQERRARARG